MRMMTGSAVILILAPLLSIAQGENADNAPQASQQIRDLVQEGTAPTMTMETVTFSVPPDEISGYQYHVATIVGQQITSSGAHPDESGIIIERVPATIVYPDRTETPQNPGQTILGARHRESNEWYFTINLTNVDLKSYVASLAVTMHQPRDEDRQSGIRSQRRNWDGPLLRYDAGIPEDRLISLRGERLSIDEALASIDDAADCVVSMEGDTVVVHECR